MIQIWYMGVSENSVALNPMVLLIIIPMKNGYFIGNINPTFSDKPISRYHERVRGQEHHGHVTNLSVEGVPTSGE